MIEFRDFTLKDLESIIHLFPISWGFDFSSFIKLYFEKDFFIGISVTSFGRIIGFGNLFIFNQVAWIGNIVIDKRFRRQGIGTDLVNNLIEIGRNLEIKTFQLFATALGKNVYAKLGFEVDSLYYAFTGTTLSIPSKNNLILKASLNDFTYIKELDFQTTGEPRDKLLELHLANTIVMKSKTGFGFYIPSIENGYIVADNDSCGIELVKYKLAHNSSVTIPENAVMFDFLDECNFTISSQIPRMVLGEKLTYDRDKIFTRGSGYFG
jgi:GNAT superfamily N-acetyltransferase